MSRKQATFYLKAKCVSCRRKATGWTLDEQPICERCAMDFAKDDHKKGGAEMNTVAVRDISALTTRQRDVLGEICFGLHGMPHHPKTLVVLVKKELILPRTVTLPGRFPVRITVYEATIAAHIAYCAWCAKRPGVEGSGK